MSAAETSSRTGHYGHAALLTEVGELAELRASHAELAHRLTQLSEESDRLAVTSVALLRLYEAVSREELLTAVRDVLVNLAGVEVFELYGSPAPGAAPSLVKVVGADRAEVGAAQFAHTAAALMRDGARKPVIAAAPDARVLGEARPLASVPLLWHGEPMGVLVVQRLLPHKPALSASDAELFELLSAHALPALSAAMGRAAGVLPRWTQA